MGKPIDGRFFGKPDAKAANATYSATKDGKVTVKIKEAGLGYEEDFFVDVEQKGGAKLRFTFKTADGKILEGEAKQTNAGEDGPEIEGTNRKDVTIKLPEPKSSKRVILGEAMISKERGVEQVYFLKQKGSYHWVVASVKDDQDMRVQLVDHKPKEPGQCSVTFSTGNDTIYVRTIKQYTVQTFDGRGFDVQDLF